jgi:hypothetical protein
VTDVPVPEPGRPQHAAGPPPHGSPLSPGGYPILAASPGPGPGPYAAEGWPDPDAGHGGPRYVGPPAPPPGWPQVPSAWQAPSSTPPSSAPPASAPPGSAPPSSGAPWRALAPAERAPASSGSTAFGPTSSGPTSFGPAAFGPGLGAPGTGRRPHSLRPIYREPLPARPGTVVIGAVAGAVWMLLFGLLGQSARSYCWWTIGAALAGGAAAAALARSGDRGIAAGAAMSTGVGLAIAMSVVVTHWLGGHWLLW